MTVVCNQVQLQFISPIPSLPALIRILKNDATTIAIATPTIPTQVMDGRDTRSIMTPPIAAPAAMDNCIMDWFRLSMIPE